MSALTPIGMNWVVTEGSQAVAGGGGHWGRAFGV